MTHVTTTLIDSIRVSKEKKKKGRKEGGDVNG